MNYLLIGRPNVGKSSIYNLLTEEAINIVHREEGTTRDWHKALIPNTKSYIFDTPGVLINEKNNQISMNKNFIDIIDSKIDTFIYVIEKKNGFNQVDNFSINLLRKYNKKLFLIINKYDNLNIEPSVEYLKYGIKKIFFISCSHKLGLKKLFTIFQNQNVITLEQVKSDLSIAIFGKPNAGKSTYLNSILGYERATTSPVAGTTSDYVVEYLNYKKKLIKIIDTAGIGKKSNIADNSINFLSIKKTFQNIRKVDFAVILIDASEGLDRQDKRIIQLVADKSKSVVLIFNKMDLIPDKSSYKLNMILDIKSTLSEIKNIKLFFISSLMKNNVLKTLEYIFNQYHFVDNEISTSKLNKWLKKATLDSQHPLIENKRVNFKYAVQVKTRPITIKIFCSYPNKLNRSYKKYLSNNFNYHFKVLNQITKLIFSSSKNPYI